MSGAPTPQTLLEAIASDAGGGQITNPMPDAPTGTNAASVQGGFPPITMEAELAGGEPPLGQDMNGFLFLISSHTMYVQCGQPYTYNSTLASAIGGYLAGTILGMTDGTGVWLNTTNGNSTNPDTGGAGWVPLESYGFANVTGLTGGTVTLSVANTKYPVIVLNGALTSNSIINLPLTKQQWLIINNTSGAFTLTVRTASALANVVVPQGGYGSPVGVYGIGDGNIYPTVTPLSVPISVAPVASTLVERDNLGNVLAVRFNGNTALENPTVGAVIVQNSAADGYFRKQSLANFVKSLFSGGLIVRTVSGNETTYNLGGVMIVKIGLVAQTVGSNQAHTFAVPFPTSCDQVVTCVADSTGVEFFSVVSGSITDAGWTQYSNNTCNVLYIATGN